MKMREYEIYTNHGQIFQMQGDEIVVKKDFFTETCKEPLCLFENNRIVAIFKEWNSVVDITEKQSNAL